MRFKRMSEIYSRLVDYTITNTNEINDFSIGSAMRAIYEAVSIEIEQFYILTQENIREAIEEGVFRSFGFTRKPASRAYGLVQISFHNMIQYEMIISRGSRFSSSDPRYPQVFETLEDFVIPRGSILADIEVYCTNTGEIGNIPANVLDVMHTPMANIKGVTNPRAFQTGQDNEPIEELHARFRSFIESLSRATIPALEFGTRKVPEVSGVYIDEKIGFVTIYAHDRNGDLPDKVKAGIELEIFHYKPAGIPVVVKPVTRKDVDVEVVITLIRKDAVTDSFRIRVEQEIARYLNNMKTSQHLIISDLNSVIKNIDKHLIYDIQFKKPTANVILAGSEIIRAGNITIDLQ